MLRKVASSLAALLVAACASSLPTPETGDEPRLGFMSSLPVLWSGNDAFAALADESAKADHWAAAALRASYALEPLDLLREETLAGIDVLLLAQPRILTPAENVALDNWVRSGGRVVVLADPRLVGDYDLPLGDPRRPLETALLSPILSRWGLELMFDPAAAPLRTVPLGDADLVVAAAGSFRTRPADGVRCARQLDGLLVQCAIGKGRAVLLADATLLEDPVGGEGSPAAIRTLLEMAAGTTRETTRENAGTAVR